MQADPPFLFLWQVKNFEGVRKRVQGYTTRPTEDMGHVAFDVGSSSLRGTRRAGRADRPAPLPHVRSARPLRSLTSA